MGIRSIGNILIRNVAFQFFICGTFDGEKEKLISRRNLVVDKVKGTNKETERVNDAVLEWLNESERVLKEVKKMEIQVESKKDEGCFMWRHSAWKHRNEMTKKMKVLNRKCEFEAICIPNPGIEHFSSGNFECFKSTKEASDQLLEALQDDSCYMTGLHGMRGSGKTKLARAVGEKAEFLKIFEAVIFVTVSHPTDVWKIQADLIDIVADWLDLALFQASEGSRAAAVYAGLQSKKRVLVILDDVREKLELDDIGIPLNSNRCKVLLTTRCQQVCTLMGCQREIPLYPLSEEEACKLFKKHSGLDKQDDEFSSTSTNLLEVASKVAMECKGLPLSIRDVGTSLRRKPIEEWEATLDGLRHTSARYQVFLSFRGDDTRLSFTGSLYHALCCEGFKTFMDDGELKGGDEISQSLIAAIEASRLSIIVLSENYAHSSWCLDELVTILECKKTKDQLVWPIFYKVDPTDVRYQKNSYGKAMEAHEKRFGECSEKVRRWRSALFEVAGLSGHRYTTTGNEYEYQFIEKIVSKVHHNKSRLRIENMDAD